MRICFIGDSFVNGTGDDDCIGWAGRLCAEARRRGRDVTCYNLGIRRDTSADIAARWEREAIARLPPEHDGRLVFSFGVNDCVHDGAARPRVAEDQSIAHAGAILSRAQAWRPTLMIGPPCTADAALDLRVGRLSDRLGAVCADLAVPFLPVFAVLQASAAWNAEARRGDGVHPNREGYARLCALILAWPPWRGWVQ